MKFSENVATIEGNAVFEETVKMSVKADSMPFIIKSLTDMYSNPVLALSREYLSNAYDACIAKMGTQSSFGTVLDTPIEVTLPSALNPNFIVRDYGVGMDRETLATVFPQYGASTKRDNNNEIGGFGLGAKSALAIVANFTVVSIKDGKKNIGIVQKGEDGVGEISFMPETETNEPSGTTITITLPNATELNGVFRDSSLLLGFPHGSILLNGKMHENSVFNTDLYTKIGEDGYVMNSLLDWENSNNYNYRSFGSKREKIVVVGPISYRVTPKDIFGEDYYSDPELADVFDASTAYSVLNLPIGSVDFTPARENLIFSEKTRKTIIEASKRVSKGVKEFAQANISDAPSKKEAARRADKLRLNGFVLDFTYKGEEIPAMTLPALHVEGKTVWVAGRHSKVTPKKWVLKVEDSPIGQTVIVTGVENAEEAKVLNRIRKPFADRYNRKSVNTDNLRVIYTEADKSELTAWTDALVLEVFTKEEWEAKGVAFRKEINDERKAKRAAHIATNPAATINYGSTPVGIVSAISSYRAASERPKVHSGYASDVVGADTVIYFRTNNEAPETMSHKFAKTMASDEGKLLNISSLNSILNMLIRHYGQDKKTVKVVRVPANTKVETFLKVVPHAIFMDDAVKVVVDAILADKGSALELLMAERSYRYSYLSRLTDTILADVQNTEVRDFITTSRASYEKVDNYRTSAEVETKAKLIFSEDFDGVFAEFRKTVQASNKFPLPLLEDLGGHSFKVSNAVQYINLMYPVAS